jgi:signal transduction histidine kinase
MEADPRFWRTGDAYFIILRALTMLGGMVAILLVPHPPEHQPYLGSLAWAFALYKACFFLTIWAWPARLRALLLASVAFDLAFVSLFVWFGGGLASHFYLLFYLLIALVAAQFSPWVGLVTAGAAGGLYALASMGHASHEDWHHLVSRVATFFLLGGALGYLSQRERTARAEAERLNRDLREKQDHLEVAYRELQAAQHRLVQAERLALIGQISAKVSHEVRNPLSSISLNAELLEDELRVLPSERREEAATILKAIRSQVDVLSAVTEEYLRFARLPKPKLELLRLDILVRELVEFVRVEMGARGITLTLGVEERLPELRLDAGQIRQVLLNLVRNAADAMPEGGVVRIEVRPFGSPEEGSRVDVTVADGGPGVPEEDRAKIFEPFFTTKDGGTGLGLAIVRQIIEDHGGSVACESRPGGGTWFRLRLPMAERDEGS